jgi:hypothetical protein
MAAQFARGSVAVATGTPSQAHERIARHQHAAEVMRARSVLAVAFGLWFVVGTGLDVASFGALGTGSRGSRSTAACSPRCTGDRRCRRGSPTR